MNDEPENAKRPQWRRKWRPRPAEERRPAAASLRDLFAPAAKSTRLLAGLLLVSLLAHVAALPFFLRHRGDISRKELDERENAYIRRVMQKEIGRRIANDLQNRITMPPPPLQPEAVIEQAITDSLVSDVSKVTAGLLTMDLQGDLANYIKTSTTSP